MQQQKYFLFITISAILGHLLYKLEKMDKIHDQDYEFHLEYEDKLVADQLVPSSAKFSDYLGRYVSIITATNIWILGKVVLYNQNADITLENVVHRYVYGNNFSDIVIGSVVLNGSFVVAIGAIDYDKFLNPTNLTRISNEEMEKLKAESEEARAKVSQDLGDKAESC